MDKISGFSDDELLVKILSFLPFKFAITTSVLSKQWKFLWMRVPKLEYDEDSMYSFEYSFRYFLPKAKEVDSETYSIVSESGHRMRSFIEKNLPLHSSPVIESLRLKFFTEVFQPEDIKLWVEIAVSRCAQELSVDLFPKEKHNALLPRNLYTCKSLVTLKLRNNILVDVPHVFSLPSLKILHLERVTYGDGESLQRLLSNCSVLEDLVVELDTGDNVRKLDVIIPSLLSLSFGMSRYCAYEGYRIDTPSLKYFKLTDLSKTFSGLIENMPKLEEANITARHNFKKLLELVTSVKRLSLNIKNNDAEEQCSRDGTMGTLAVFWNQPNSVPQCLLSTLQTFEWSGYPGSVQGKDLATYILRKSRQLKIATISIGYGLDPQQKLKMEMDVKFSFRASPTCKRVFY
ncbi:Leucine-rich repeat 2 [Arabidopsis suecica]|uniref:Leucine-rich repeat 2 n=1 Tax=Arabidopsis suecica TaxID=45249 RepID=A0A8T2DU30_ARASU|nr:Leucine-rich repeat 2 [Arabidopsis suecica]